MRGGLGRDGDFVDGRDGDFDGQLTTRDARCFVAVGRADWWAGGMYVQCFCGGGMGGIMLRTFLARGVGEAVVFLAWAGAVRWSVAVGRNWLVSRRGEGTCVGVVKVGSRAKQGASCAREGEVLVFLMLQNIGWFVGTREPGWGAAECENGDWDAKKGAPGM
jgi:hypothetical protein